MLKIRSYFHNPTESFSLIQSGGRGHNFIQNLLLRVALDDSLQIESRKSYWRATMTYIYVSISVILIGGITALSTVLFWPNYLGYAYGGSLLSLCSLELFLLAGIAILIITLELALNIDRKSVV